MKKKIYPLVVATFIICLLNTGLLSYLAYDKIDTYIKNKPIVISKDYDKGQSLAKALETNKPVIVWFYTDWCRYCQKFAPTFKKIAKDKEIKKQFAIAYVNAEELENKIYVQEYDIKGYPTIYLVKGDEKFMISPVDLFVPDAVKSLKKKFQQFLN